MPGSDALLRVENLTVTLSTRDGLAPVLDDISFSLKAGESIGLVGESGCGKSMMALALMGLVPQPVGAIASGRIWLDGEDLVNASEARMREVRGNEISMIFQEPMTSLNPVYSIGEQIAEVLRRHQHMNRRQAMSRAAELLDAVRVPDPARRIRDYPHQLSGGQRQRVMIAMALACEPRVLIADEPTTALDVTVQAQIFDLLNDLQTKTGTSVIMITHDMGAIAEMSERMIVMYAGRVVEEGTVDAVLDSPRHPYTRGLIACVPHIQDSLGDERESLVEIPGIVPPLSEFGRDACMFASRCQHVSEKCLRNKPVDEQFDGQHRAACWHLDSAL